MADGLLLDTCAVIWLSQNAPVAPSAVEAIAEARATGMPIVVSVMTAWELGMLVSKGRLASTKHPDRWFEEFVRSGEVDVAGVDVGVLVASSYLPEPVHSDPIDRIIIATARDRNLRIVTRDRAILGYADAGNVKALAC